MKNVDKVKKYLETLKNEIDSHIKDIFPKKGVPSALYESIKYHLDIGGKRFRPAMVILSHKALGGSSKDILYPAAAIELLHEFSLIHDDIMDCDEKRRGKDTVWKKYGIPFAILSGDIMYAYAYHALTLSLPKIEKNAYEIFRTFTDAIIYINEGQGLDLEFESRDDVKVDEYMEMVWKKTGALIAAAMKLGALYAHADKSICDTLWMYGKSIGPAFQIKDDLLTLVGSFDEVGKEIGNDIKQGKKTLSVVHALEYSKERKELLSILKKDRDSKTDEDIKRAIDIIKETGSIEFSQQKATHLANDAKESLKILEDSEAKEILTDLTDYLINRSS